MIMIKAFSKYLEQLCRLHEKLRHSDDERHFVNLNEDSKNGATDKPCGEGVRTLIQNCC